MKDNTNKKNTRVLSKQQKRKKEILSWVWAILFVLILRQFFVQAFVIPSESMKPTLKIHDRLLANKIIYKIREPRRWEVIIFKYPEDTKKYFVKRLVGLGGESLAIRNGHVYIDGKIMTQPESVSTPLYYYNDIDGSYGVNGEVKIPAGTYYVLGDNSINSKDSRYWGFVPSKNLVGKALFIYWPPWRMGFIR
ncbi:MAG: signal peptidase I [Candidatus Omnitrophica bacterium]|nr:signal peptidase I [Candidatus Omnitrophota bacterium]MCM8788804.1 signal peptidase I [Candidatus Omnitrophota bacterium]